MNLKNTLLTILAFTAFTAMEANAGSETIGMAFLTIPQGARETAMGETGASYSGGGTGIWWNPANIAATKSDVWFQGFQWIGDMNGSFGGARLKTGWGGLGLYYVNYSMDGFEARTRPGPPEAAFTVHQAIIGGGTAVRLGKNWTFGAATKFAYESMYSSSESRFLIFDAGVAKGFKNTSIGASIQNIIFESDEEETPPATVRFGISHRLSVNDFGVLAAVEGVDMEKRDPSAHIGLEADWRKILFIRAGYMSSYDSRDFTAGFGIRYRRISADFGLTPFGNELGTSWRFGLGLRI